VSKPTQETASHAAVQRHAPEMVSSGGGPLAADDGTGGRKPADLGSSPVATCSPTPSLRLVGMAAAGRAAHHQQWGKGGGVERHGLPACLIMRAPTL